ncbi:MAG: uncharacterized SAM-binding protein YcdF (DUF218 family) [Planctomycetota bacterium]|jgi:uncharacterized SAM-binding protein YcdF (DUF218 family)
MGISSIFCAWSGDVALWVSPLFGSVRAWNALSGFGWLFLAVHCLWPLARPIRLALLLFMATLGVAALVGTNSYYQLVSSGGIQTRFPLPASLGVLALALAGLWVMIRPRGSARGTLEWTLGLFGAGLGGLAAPLVLLLTFGATDYRRPADCAVVLGAAVQADGRPTLSLSDRVDEAVRLYHSHHVEHIVMSGGIDPHHGLSEAQVMRERAIAAGVPADCIELDEEGKNTRASANNCAVLLRDNGWEDALLVSHDYHLLRSKTAFRRAGMRVYTVPATETRPLGRWPYFVLRECVAWLYYSMPS